ncbi:MAG: hypothetical protein JJT94_06990 [Bernardetiaceae bacterium]|nr:hypothetical protein [Bernardetiaceae bacterium]
MKLQRSVLCISFTAFLLVFFISTSHAQETEAAQEARQLKSEFNMGGRILMLTDFQGNWYYNMGGPNVMIEKNHWKLSLHMMPSLRFNSNNKPNIQPTLGAGLHIAYRFLVIGQAFYYIPSENRWQPTWGAGLRLGSKLYKKQVGRNK